MLQIRCLKCFLFSCLVGMCIHFEGETDSCLEVKADRLWKNIFPGLMQEFSWMLLSPTPLQQSTRPLQPWPRPLRLAAPWIPGLSHFYHLGLGLRCLRATQPSKNFHPACEGLKMGSPSKMFFRARCRRSARCFGPPPSTTAVHKTTPALISPAALAAPWMPGLLDF